jgi:hypothetical protein
MLPRVIPLEIVRTATSALRRSANSSPLRVNF